jgi:small subunit ribosomal protein S8e
MAVSHAKDLRKATGGRKRKARDKQKAELGSLPTNTTIWKESEKELKRTRGGNHKVKLRYADKANVYDPKTKKYQLVALRTEKENPANRNFARMNILTKGAIVDTDIGTVKITSRPGQHGVVNAVLLEKKQGT